MRLHPFLFAIPMTVLAACSGDLGSNGTSTTSNGDGGAGAGQGSGGAGGSIEQVVEGIHSVFVAQTHVLRTDDAFATLVGNRPALLKVHIVDPDTPAAPLVQAILQLDGETETIDLAGPENIPATVDVEPGSAVHMYDNAFTATIPAAWVKPGLVVEIASQDHRDSYPIRVGAPTVVHMTMFDVSYLRFDGDADYPAGWLEELESKWPVSSIELTRIPDVDFPELVVPPRAGVGAARVTSREDYLAQTGLPFDGEQATALQWVGALKRAGGQSNVALYYVNIYGVSAGGQAGGFSGVGNGRQDGILHHELGHALSLPHWGDAEAYPYKGAMHGVAPPESYNETHAGPTWAFDLRTMSFIPALVQPGNPDDAPAGTYKKDPMQGGGKGDQEPAFLLRHFSDYSVNQMRNYLEGHVAVHDAAAGTYAKWDAEQSSYSAVVQNNGVGYPLEHDVDVISVMAATSMADAAINFVYPLIGPYRSGLIRTFDPRVQADREAAAANFCQNTGCDYSLRITQGGTERVVMLRASGDVTDPLAGNSLNTAAVNLRASDGDITSVALLSTPNAEQEGMPGSPTVLYSWSSD